MASSHEKLPAVALGNASSFGQLQSRKAADMDTFGYLDGRIAHLERADCDTRKAATAGAAIAQKAQGD